MPARPASSEEVECWTHATDSLRILSSIYAKPSTLETIGRVNRLISAWPTDDIPPAEGIDALRLIQEKLKSGLSEIFSAAEHETGAIDDAIERVGVLIALRKAPEPLPPAEKRNKRPRAHSPSGTPIPAASAIGNTRSVSITVPPRTSSVGPSAHTRDPRSKKDGVVKQPLQVGRKVVFRPPKSVDAEEGTWIVATIVKVLSADKQGKYEVQDVEPQDDGQPGATYIANLKSIVPLPEPGVPIGNPAHINFQPIFPLGETVLALYPDTSCFYRAEVISNPRAEKDPSNKHTPTYQVKFEDDEDQLHTVSAYWVVRFPQHLLNS